MEAFINSLKFIGHILGILGRKYVVHVLGVWKTRQSNISAFEDLLVQQSKSDNENKCN